MPLLDLLHRLSPIAFVAGFLFDWLTLRRVDDVGSNVQLTAYLLASAALLVAERRAWHGRRSIGLVRRYREFARYGIQFLFGGLANAYLIFYSKSATLGPTLLFCAILVAASLANEWKGRQLTADAPQLAAWFFAALSYLLFAIPTWTPLSLGTGRFLAAVLALVAASAVTAAIHVGPVVDPLPPRLGDPTRLGRALGAGLATWTAMLGVLVVLARLGAIPPVPLALTEAGVYRAVARDGDRMVFTPPVSQDTVVLRPGESVSCYTAVFAPRGAELALFHVWERRDGDWLEVDRIAWEIRGGREAGWRTWSAKSNVVPGDWRVRVLTEEGVEVGRVAFTAVAAP